jgi:hypothetical protein
VPLLKYTTEVEAARSIGEIMGILTEMDAQQITVTYQGQQRLPIALEFKVDTVHGLRSFRLPARLDGVLEILQASYDNGSRKHGRPTLERAANVAWRILKAWAEAQLALVQIGLASTDEIMLPYMLVSAERTVYEDYTERQQALPSGSGG